MEQYGYMYNKFLKDVNKFSTKPNLSIKNSDSNYTAFFAICVVLFIVIARYT